MCHCVGRYVNWLIDNDSKFTYIIFVGNSTFVFYVKPAVSYLVLIKIYIPMACFTYRNMDDIECYSVLGLVHSCFR